jgi:2,4-dienoyl-CoA reductase (NADPH2)
VAEEILAAGCADMVSMARPLLADPEFVNKAAQDRALDINTCIACNQACLDHVFQRKRASCLVNPRACHETEMVFEATVTPKRLAVVGGGAAGLSFACHAAERGHVVTLFEAAQELGGQLNLAKRVPGKEEFCETLRYFGRRLATAGVTVRLGERATLEALMDFDEVILASGVLARSPDFPGSDHPKVISYPDLLSGRKLAGKSVAIIGAGGIGFDVAEFLVQLQQVPQVHHYLSEWGVDDTHSHRGGLLPAPQPPEPSRAVFLLQRKTDRMGADLGKTTGWIHRATLKAMKVKMQGGIHYERIDDDGLWIRDGKDAGAKCLAVDSVILCAGQVSERSLEEPLKAAGKTVHLIGGAALAAELDAQRAIREGAELAAKI